MSLRHFLRRHRGLAGVEVYRARGGYFVCPVPRAGHAVEPRSFPSSCRLAVRRTTGGVGGRLEWAGAGGVETLAVHGFVRLPMVADGALAELQSIDVYDYLFRHERRTAIREWRRVLEPGGALVIRGLPDFRAIATAYLSARQAGNPGGFDLDQVFRRTHGDPARADRAELLRKDVFTPEAVGAELEAAGYDITRIQPVTLEADPLPLAFDVEARRRG